MKNLILAIALTVFIGNIQALSLDMTTTKMEICQEGGKDKKKKCKKKCKKECCTSEKSEMSENTAPGLTYTEEHLKMVKKDSKKKKKKLKAYAREVNKKEKARKKQEKMEAKAALKAEQQK